MAALSTVATSTLIMRVETTIDPAMLWQIHVELDARDIVPCLRWPAARDPTMQIEFVTFAADFLWLCRRHNTSLSPQYRGWRALVTTAVDGPAWHAVLHRQFVYAIGRTSVAHWCATGLGLSPVQRQGLMSLPTRDMAADRRQLQSDRFAEVTERLMSHALAHRDKSGAVSPDTVALRRSSLWRVFILSGRNQTTAAKHWHRLTGATLTRQALAKQIDIVTAVLRDRG